jgi:hypothetical protein
MAAKAGIISYTIELRDTGMYGFILPKDNIKPMGREIWEAMRVFVDVSLESENVNGTFMKVVYEEAVEENESKVNETDVTLGIEENDESSARGRWEVAFVLSVTILLI